MSSSNTTGTKNNTNIPDRFVCPLTLELMKYPYQDAVSGNTFERTAILEWMLNCDEEQDQVPTCPLTRQPLDPSNFRPNNELLMEIYEWKRQHNLLTKADSVRQLQSDQLDQEQCPNKRKVVHFSSAAPTVVAPEGQEDPNDLTSLSQKILQRRQEKAKQFVARQQHTSRAPQPHAALSRVPSYMQLYM
ncbi:U-box domain-containing protein [Seminavis robusta]|uniref:U-box domain-containing protein n=1 Tax=Seminavis robusta TaxID=568900 RepID=A0A9N8H9L8_9STRA|nr:U-box domain-containing protein [Seminavis robusta]|eukprot:Sro121_g058770.1 U-box domain-containing protein (189) ;mRNA; r:21885-22451